MAAKTYSTPNAAVQVIGNWDISQKVEGIAKYLPRSNGIYLGGSTSTPYLKAKEVIGESMANETNVVYPNTNDTNYSNCGIAAQKGSISDATLVKGKATSPHIAYGITVVEASAIHATKLWCNRSGYSDGCIPDSKILKEERIHAVYTSDSNRRYNLQNKRP